MYMNTKIKSWMIIAAMMVSMTPAMLTAQEEAEIDKGGIASYGEPDFFRPYDKRGLHMFETTKDDMNKAYNGRKFSIGAGFSLQFQSLKHENPGALNNDYESAQENALAKLAPGFSLPQANLYIDAQLADGIRLHLANYMASKHHNEFWVKGGYLQVDKIPFKGEIWDKINEVVTIKAGHMEINYGDAHFRRPDGGHTSYSPFIESNIMDAFATEIAAEVYAQKNGWIGMVGLSNGMIKGHTEDAKPTANGFDKRNPSVYLKGGWDKQLNEDLRLRFTGSLYHNAGTNGSGLTLYAGDRTGSNYNLVMDQYFSGGTAKAATALFRSGRFDPSLNGKLTSVMLNAFAKTSGFEFFGTAELANGRSNAATDTEDRAVNQYAAEGIYRFGDNENLFVGARYNIVNAEIFTGGALEDVKIDRFALGAGWFLTKNVLLKGEYVNQKYSDFPNIDYRHNGKFNGVVFQAAIGF
jgi:hypothetical protein